MKVSVCITAYNHERFIAQALDSVLMQETNFDFEILVGEDDSTDSTREIVTMYKDKHPRRIRLFLNDRKNVIHINGRPTGRWNFANNIKHAYGEYIALLDGDDYWISPQKLQTQVDYLDQHPEVALCCHNVQVEYSETPEQNHLRFDDNDHETPFLLLHKPKPISTLDDILNVNFTLTVSLMFRSAAIEGFPAWFYQAPVADHPLVVLAAQAGKIGYIDEVMAAYRVHRGGIYSSNQDQILRIKDKIRLLKMFDEHFQGKYNHILSPAISGRTATLVRLMLENGKTRAARQQAWATLREANIFDKSTRRLLKMLLKSYIFF